MAATAERRKLPPAQYDMLKRLIEMGGDKQVVPTADFSSKDKKVLNALKNAGGFLKATEQKNGRGSTVVAAQVIANLNDFDRNAERRTAGGGDGTGARPRQARATGNGTRGGRKAAGSGQYGRLTIEAIERFVKDFKDRMTERTAEVVKDIDTRIKEAQKAVATAKSDDELGGATRRLSEEIARKASAKQSVQTEVLAEMSKGVETPVQWIIDGMVAEDQGR